MATCLEGMGMGSNSTLLLDCSQELSPMKSEGMRARVQYAKIRPDSYKDLCPVCTGAGNLMTFKSYRGGLEYWPCPGCHGAGVSVQYGPAVFTKRAALVGGAR